ncbi:MAG: 50S ribosomal protein L19 [Candidatus Paceibacterota bacterium]
MEKQIEEFAKQVKRTDIPQIKSGDTVRVYQKYRDKDKDKIQMFEGMVICRKHGNESGAAITVRKIASGVGVEKIFPLHSPIIDKIEVIRSGKTRRAKLYFIRDAKGKKAKLKQIVTGAAKKTETKKSSETEEAK